MASVPSVDDLLLVEAITRHGSLAAAARELLISQPAASQRLARLERQVGLPLFDRDTTGARATAAGLALAREASHTLQHLNAAFDRARAAAQTSTLRIGCFASLAPLLFPALEELAPEIAVAQSQDHGNRLLEWVGEGSLDAAFVAIAEQLPIPPNTTATVIGRDSYVLVLPPGAEPQPGGRIRLTGQRLLTHTFDLSVPALHERLARMGASAQLAATSETAILTARVRGTGAVVTQSQARRYALADEQLISLRIRPRPTIFMVTRAPVPEQLRSLRAGLATALGLAAPRR